MKNFFSLEYFYELKTFFILEFIMLILLVLIFNTHSNNIFFSTYNLFNIWAFVISIVIYLLSSLIDPKKYFNFFTLISSFPFAYGCFWFMFTFIPLK